MKFATHISPLLNSQSIYCLTRKILQFSFIWEIREPMSCHGLQWSIKATRCQQPKKKDLPVDKKWATFGSGDASFHWVTFVRKSLLSSQCFDCARFDHLSPSLSGFLLELLFGRGLCCQDYYCCCCCCCWSFEASGCCPSWTSLKRTDLYCLKINNISIQFLCHYYCCYLSC